MEKGALAHIEYAQFISVRLPFLPHTRNERDICHCEIFRYSHISVLHLSVCAYVRVYIGTFNGNSIQCSRRSKYFNYKHVSFYLFRFFSLFILLRHFIRLGPPMIFYRHYLFIDFYMKCCSFFCSSHTFCALIQTKNIA